MDAGNGQGLPLQDTHHVPDLPARKLPLQSKPLDMFYHGTSWEYKGFLRLF